MVNQLKVNGSINCCHQLVNEWFIVTTNCFQHLPTAAPIASNTGNFQLKKLLLGKTAVPATTLLLLRGRVYENIVLYMDKFKCTSSIDIGFR